MGSLCDGLHLIVRFTQWAPTGIPHWRLLRPTIGIVIIWIRRVRRFAFYLRLRFRHGPLHAIYRRNRLRLRLNPLTSKERHEPPSKEGMTPGKSCQLPRDQAG